MGKTDKRKLGIVGVTGEYFVAAELSQRGIVAVLTLKNTPSIDILATNLEKGRSVNIQAKTMSTKNKTGWRLSEKDEIQSKIKNHFYVFVNLRGLNQLPEYYVIPQKNLAEFIFKNHRDWLAIPKKDGSKRKDTSIRLFAPHTQKTAKEFSEKYKNNWEILKLL